MRRREILGLAVASVAIPLLRSSAARAQAPRSLAIGAAAGKSERLEVLWNQLLQEQLHRKPQQASALGLDKDDNSALKFRLNDRSLQGRAADRAASAERLRQLAKVERAALQGMAAIDYETILYKERSVARLLAFDYGAEDAFGAAPYVLSQLTGAYQNVPEFLVSQHRIDTAVDADAYVSRLEAFATGIEADTERFRHDTGAGVIPPDFLLDTTLAQLVKSRATPATADVVVSLEQRAREKGLSSTYAEQGRRLYGERIGPALDRQIEALRAVRPSASHEAGVWRLKDGAAFYAAGLHSSTTTDMTPEEVHQLGLTQGAEVSARLDEVLKGQGLTQGTVAARVQALYRDPSRFFPNTPAGKQEIIDFLNGRLTAVKARLSRNFGRIPRYAVVVRPVPAAIDAGAPPAYTEFPAPDGSRPGIIYFNLHDTGEMPKWNLPSTLYHEGLPGHQLQGGVALENTAIPLLRRAMFFSGYGEGWAVYAEQLADELGMYEDDPLGRVGYLKAQLFRCGRLVVDTGIHHYRWSREKAVEYLTGLDGDAVSSTTREISRYCAEPGQASSYKIGHTVWNRLRDRARKQLDLRFDIRSFHDVALAAGALPLDLLDRVVAEWTRSQQGQEGTN
jgi:uncharacterized protein (DUF885 family)